MRATLRGWYTAADFEALAARKATLAGELKLRDLARLTDYLCTTRGWDDRRRAGAGVVKAELAFGLRQLGVLTLKLDYEARLNVVCQRCLEPFEMDIANQVELAVMTSEALAAEWVERDDPIVLENEEKLCPAQLVEDELIISIPLAPKHATLDQCASAYLPVSSNV